MQELRTKREIALSVVHKAFSKRDRVRIIDVIAAGQDAGVSRRTIQRAAREVGVREVHNGREPAYWEKG